MGRDPSRDHVDRRGRPDTMPVATPVSRCQRKRSTARSDEAADQGADADQDRAQGRERADRAQRQQAVEGERPQGAGRDQGGKLVEGAVADPPVVVVVEAVQLQDEDPDRAEQHRPEEGRDVGGRGRARWRRRAPRSAPASRRRRAGGAAAPRAGVGAARRRVRLSRAVAGRRLASRRGPARRESAWRRCPGSLGVIGPSATVPSFAQALRLRVQPAGVFEVAPAPPLRRRPRARPWSAGSTAASCGPRVRSPGRSRSIAVG